MAAGKCWCAVTVDPVKMVELQLLAQTYQALSPGAEFRGESFDVDAHGAFAAESDQCDSLYWFTTASILMAGIISEMQWTIMDKRDKA